MEKINLLTAPHYQAEQPFLLLACFMTSCQTPWQPISRNSAELGGMKKDVSDGARFKIKPKPYPRKYSEFDCGTIHCKER